MAEEYKHNHYVPEWYQKRFLLPGQSKQFYLDLYPETIEHDRGRYSRRSILEWGPKKCFAQDDLYTTEWGGLKNRDIEKFFFGRYDSNAPKALDHYANYELSEFSESAFHTILPYMSVQKLRTPKGLGWLQKVSRTRSKNDTLLQLQRLQNLFVAVWTESVWQIADASRSATKFIISDHPVVAYNRECFPGSKWCAGFNTPDIRMVATHTYFPLSLEKILILTNLAWVRDPYQNPQRLRPNPKFLRNAMGKLDDVHVERFLTEEEVREINYITKRSAHRYVAAANKDWLFPERHLRCTHWRRLGDGYLLMPDPRHIHGGGELIIGYKDGTSEAFSEYGHRPWQKGYQDKRRSDREWEAMNRFKAEWSAAYGPEYRGVVPGFSGKVHRSMGDEYHARECERDRAYSKLKGERARRRSLRRTVD